MIIKSIICKASAHVLAVAALTGCASLPPQLSTSRPAYNGPIPIIVATPADAGESRLELKA
jgi:hypothetical protein